MISEYVLKAKRRSLIHRSEVVDDVRASTDELPDKPYGSCALRGSRAAGCCDDVRHRSGVLPIAVLHNTSIRELNIERSGKQGSICRKEGISTGDRRQAWEFGHEFRGVESNCLLRTQTIERDAQPIQLNPYILTE